MNTLWITDAQAQAILTQALAEAPREACGLLAGREGRVMAVVPVTNSAADPLHEYRIDTTALSTHLPQFEREGWSLLGFYHTHPTDDPLPSATDIARAAYPDLAYLIVGLRGAPRLAAWRIRYGVVEPVPVHVGDLPPAKQPETVPLSDAQRFAIIVATLLAFGMLIGLSLILLPPAPPIP